MDLVTRAQWGARPPKAITPWNPDRLLGGAQHWFGSPNGATDHGRCDDLMRSVQNTHMGPGGLGVPNGGNDIGYNHVVCLHGKVYEGRGFLAQTGANGTTDGNRNYYSMCVMMGTGNAVSVFNDTVKKALRELQTEWVKLGAGSVVLTHKYFTGSTCPGPTVTAWLLTRPFSTPIPPTGTTLYPWLGDWLRWLFVDLRDPTKRPANVPDFATLTKQQRDELWELAPHVDRTITLAGPREPFFDWDDWRDTGSDPETRPPFPVPQTIPQPWWDGRRRLHQSHTGPPAQEPPPPPPPASGTAIIAEAQSSADQARTWATNRGAPLWFVPLADLYYELAPQHGGVRADLAWAQCCKETNFGRFGGVLDPTFKNPCGMKTTEGGANSDPDAHQRFATWREGITAHLDHLALYSGASGYPRADTPDPRHFPAITATATTWEALGGKWAPASDYGASIVELGKFT